MLQHIQGAWLLVLMAAAGRMSHVIPKEEGCQGSTSTAKAKQVNSTNCLGMWLKLVKNVDDGIRPQYDCVLKQIFEFYDEVLKEWQSEVPEKEMGAYMDLWHLFEHLKSCKPKVDCPELCITLNSTAQAKPLMKVNNISCLKRTKLAIFQIQKLQQAKDQLSEDVNTLKKAIVELKGLHFYFDESNTTKEKCLKKKKKRKPRS